MICSPVCEPFSGYSGRIGANQNVDSRDRELPDQIPRLEDLHAEDDVFPWDIAILFY